MLVLNAARVRTERIVDAILKAAVGRGEGSRGGKVVGHTKSGKPIYLHQDHSKPTPEVHTNPGNFGRNIRAGVNRRHADFTAAEHREAEDLHHKLYKEQGGLHFEHAQAHHNAAERKGGSAGDEAMRRQGEGIIGHTDSGKMIPGNLEPAHAYRTHGMKDWSAEDHEQAAQVHDLEAQDTPGGQRITVDHGPEAGGKRDTDARQHHRLMAEYHRGHAHRIRRDASPGHDFLDAAHAYGESRDKLKAHVLGPLDQCPPCRLMLKSDHGESSRGGHVIGHTASGKPIYDRHDHPEHAGFSIADHEDAIKAHARAPYHPDTARHHSSSALKHSDAIQRLKGKDKVHTVLHEFKHGTLHSGSKTGPVVQERKQAVAIALHSRGDNAER